MNALYFVFLAASGSYSEAAAIADQERLKILLERVRTPVAIRANEPPIAGVFSTIGVERPNLCTTKVTTTIPAFDHPSYKNPKPVSQSGAIKFGEVEWTKIDGEAVYFGPSFPTLRYLKAGSAAEAVEVRQIVSRLITYCRNASPAAVSATADPASPRVKGGTGIGAWTHDGKDALGFARCRFDRVPPLVLRETGNALDGKAFASFEQVAEGGEARLTVRMTRFPGRPPAGWAEAYAVPLIKVPIGIAAHRGRMTIDGHDAGYEFDLGWGTYSPPDGYGARPVTPSGSGFPGWAEFLNKVAGGSVAELTLYDPGNRPVRDYRFDVSALRNAIPALNAANWICQGSGRAPG